MKRDGGQLWHPVADQTSFYDSFLTLQVVKGHSLPNKMQRKMLVSHDTEEHLFSIDIVIRKLGYKVVINSGFGGLFRSATLLLAWLLRTSRLDWCNSDSRFPWAPALLLLTSLLRIDIGCWHVFRLHDSLRTTRLPLRSVWCGGLVLDMCTCRFRWGCIRCW